MRLGFATCCLIPFAMLGTLVAPSARGQSPDASAVRVEPQVRHGAMVEAVAFSPDGAYVATVCSSPKTVLNLPVCLWEAETGIRLRCFGPDRGGAFAIAFSPDGTHLAAGLMDGTTRVWSVSTGAEVRRLADHGWVVNAVAFSPDGTRLATTSPNGSLIVYDTATWAKVWTSAKEPEPLLGVAFSPDGARLATASADSTVRVWDAELGLVQLRLRGHEGQVASVAFSPDGTHLLTASTDRTARLWDAQTGALSVRFEEHTGRLEFAAFSPDGAYILTTSQNGSTHLWSATGELISRFADESPPTRYALFSPDGAHILAGGGSDSIRLWTIATHTSTLRFGRFSAESIREVVVNDDGTRQLVDAPNRRLHGAENHPAPLATLITFPDDSWVAFDAEGRYDSSDPSGGHLAWLRDTPTGPQPMRVAEALTRFHDPGLLAKYLRRNDAPLRTIR